MNRMKVKVCGMRDAANISDLIQLRPDYIGFIFYDKSPRFVEDLDEKVMEAIPDEIKKVGVFVNETTEKIKEKISTYSLDLVQLHGDESPEICRTLQKENIEVIKAISVATVEDIKRVEPYAGAVDYFLFDTKGKNFGGNGISFDWKILDAYPLDVPYFISGGIGMDELNFLGKTRVPHAIDINSKFEQSPGRKDIELLKKGFDQINNLRHGKI